MLRIVVKIILVSCYPLVTVYTCHTKGKEREVLLRYQTILLVPQKMQAYNAYKTYIHIHESYEKSRKSKRMLFAYKPTQQSQCHLFQRLANDHPRHSFSRGLAHPSADRASLQDWNKCFGGDASMQKQLCKQG